MKLLFSKISSKYPRFHDHMTIPEPVYLSTCWALISHVWSMYPPPESRRGTNHLNQMDWNGWGLVLPPTLECYYQKGKWQAKPIDSHQRLKLLSQKKTLLITEGEVKKHGKPSTNSSLQLGKNSLKIHFLLQEGQHHTVIRTSNYAK